MSENVLEVTDDTFDAEVRNSDLPVLVDFWAPWCGPCLSIAPVLEELATEYGGKIKIAKINVEDNPQSPTEFQVRSIPNLCILKGGQLQQQLVGAVAKQELVSAIDKVISSDA